MLRPPFLKNKPTANGISADPQTLQELDSADSALLVPLVVTNCLVSSGALTCLMPDSHFCDLCIEFHYFPCAEAYIFIEMVPISLPCYSYTFQLGKTFVISISFSSVRKQAKPNWNWLIFPSLSSLPPVFILSANLETAFHGLMTFTYSIIHNCGSEIDPGGISHLILSSILRSFHLWTLCVAQVNAFPIVLNSSRIQHHFGILSKAFWHV